MFDQMADHRTYKEILLEIFPHRPEECIENIIGIVEENSPDGEYMLEEMINLLTESGDSTVSNLFAGYQEEAAGFGHTDTGGYVIKGSRSDSIFEQLSDMMPDADPDYLRNQAEILAEKTETDLENFIDEAIDKRNYPTKKDYYKRQKTIDGLKIYTTNFTVEDFLSVIPEPFVHFDCPSYNSALAGDSGTKEDETYAINTLLDCFPYLREKDIRKVFNKYNKNIVKTSNTLARIPRHFKTPRKQLTHSEECENLQLLQEIAFIKNKQELRTAIKMKDHLYRLARIEAEKYNLLETCQCCFFEGLLPEECYFCKKNCPFCKECVAKGAEIVIGKGELVFPCLSNCNSAFEIATIKMVLDKKVFEPLFSRIQKDELEKANIEGLETCPSCDCSMILPDSEKIIKCQNEECMEESCRECRHKSHVPLRCDEIEYDEDVKKRTYIENKMTEALLRTCWKCKKSFLKESGCNKMTCPCGAKMCYVCGTSDIGYDHFGEISRNKCPLYTQDLQKFHAERVLKSAKIAKSELGVDINPHLLKIDPTEGLEEFFDSLQS